MGGIAAIAKQSGHTVTGCDKNIYPPMSTQLEVLGIDLYQGFDENQLDRYKADAYIVGNVMTRGMPVIEKMLSDKIPMVSGPDWLYQHVLNKRKVVAISGTHGKTTTSSMVAWILQDNGFEPGFLIGGVPGNFEVSARLGGSDLFVIEADEYDTAFFDKRSKFIHYHPDTLILNNLEFDHADIFFSLEDIERQFHHLLKLIPKNGQLIANADDRNIHELIKKGCWSQLDHFGTYQCNWQVKSADNNEKFRLNHHDNNYNVYCMLPGVHNQLNLAAAIAACNSMGVCLKDAIASAATFKAPKRRLELKFNNDLVSVYDDFAHHPTAIKKTTEAVKKPGRRLLVIFEPRSNSMQSGAHSEGLTTAFADADEIILYTKVDLRTDFSFLEAFYQKRLTIFTCVDKIIEHLSTTVVEPTDVIFMSNGGFDNIVNKYTNTLELT